MSARAAGGGLAHTVEDAVEDAVDESIAGDRSTDFTYSDGATVEERILELLRAADDLSADAWIARDEQETSWPVRYHLSPLRANLFRHLALDGLSVLELGAGLGGASRDLAERAERFVAVEGSPTRAEGLRLRLRDLVDARPAAPRVLTSRLEEVELADRFDLVCVIGVLEYAELHVRTPPGVDPFVHFLRRAASHLRPGGLLAIAIENRLGVKYWTGAPEDHTGVHFEGVAGYRASPTPRTFSRRELRQVLERADLEVAAEHLPFPDYKLPHQVLDARLADEDPRLAVDMACFSPFIGYDVQRVHLMPDYLALDGLARAGLFREFANSFLVFASARGDETARERMRRMVDPDALAWHYAPDRAIPTRTVVRSGDAGLRIHKEVLEPAREAVGAVSVDAVSVGAVSLDAEPPADELDAIWSPPEPGPPAPGEPLRLRLLRSLYFGDSDRFLAQLEAFVGWARGRFAHGGDRERHGDRESNDQLAGEALDAVVRNASIDASERYHLYDLEWRFDGAMRESWFVLRNVLALSDDFFTVGRRSRWTSLAGLYGDLCEAVGVEPALDDDLDREAAFLARVLGRPARVMRGRLAEAMSREFERRLEGVLGDIATGRLPEVAVLAERVDHLERATRSVLETVAAQERSMGRFDRTLDALHAALGGPVREQLDHQNDSSRAIHATLEEIHAALDDQRRSVGALHEALAHQERIASSGFAAIDDRLNVLETLAHRNVESDERASGGD